MIDFLVAVQTSNHALSAGGQSLVSDVDVHLTGGSPWWSALVVSIGSGTAGVLLTLIVGTATRRQDDARALRRARAEHELADSSADRQRAAERSEAAATEILRLLHVLRDDPDARNNDSSTLHVVLNDIRSSESHIADRVARERVVWVEESIRGASVVQNWQGDSPGIVVWHAANTGIEVLGALLRGEPVAMVDVTRLKSYHDAIEADHAAWIDRQRETS